MKQLHIFIAFFRSGMLGFGGGPSAIPLVQKEVVDVFKWMDNEEFINILSIGNTLPGPIATKLAGYIGYRVGGVLGLINAILATVLPTVLLMILLLTSLKQYRDASFIKGMTAGVVPIVGVMLGVITWEFLKKSMNSLTKAAAIIMLIVSFVLMEILAVHPGIIIGVLLLSAFLLPTKKSA